MKIWKRALSVSITGVMLAAAPMTALAASPEFARTSEEWARLRDNKMEYEELELARRDLQSMELQFQQGKASQNQLTTQQYDLQNKELAMKTADLNLFQTMETYDWAVKGLASAA